MVNVRPIRLTRFHTTTSPGYWEPLSETTGPDGSAHPTSLDLAATRRHRARRPKGTEAHSCAMWPQQMASTLNINHGTKSMLIPWMEEILHHFIRGFSWFIPLFLGFQHVSTIQDSSPPNVTLPGHIGPLLNRQHRQLRAWRVAWLRGALCWLSLWNPCTSACSVKGVLWVVGQGVSHCSFTKATARENQIIFGTKVEEKINFHVFSEWYVYNAFQNSWHLWLDPSLQPRQLLPTQTGASSIESPAMIGALQPELWSGLGFGLESQEPFYNKIS